MIDTTMESVSEFQMCRECPKIALDFVIGNQRESELAGLPYNEFITSFCHAGFISEIKRMIVEHYPMKQLMNHKSLKKELTESYGAICIAEKALKRITELRCEDEFGCCNRLQDRLIFYDVCSGKGLLSFLLSMLFPLARIVMVDFNAKLKLDHLHSQRLQNISYKHMDINKMEFEAYLQDQSSAAVASGHIPIMIGLHLCGTLSSRLCNIFNRITQLPLLIVSPCCMPRHKDATAEMKAVLKRSGWEPYQYWCLAVHGMLDPTTCTREILQDERVLSEKRTFVVAIKRSSLTSAAATSS